MVSLLSPTTDAMEVDDPPAAQSAVTVSQERLVSSKHLQYHILCFLIVNFSLGLLFPNVGSFPPPPFPPATCRIEAFNSLFGQHMRANHLDLISVADIENVVNSGADFHYARTEIMFLLEVQYLI